MNHRTALFVTLTLCFSIIVPAVGAAPTNDDIAGAIALTEGVEVSFNNLDATEEVTEDICPDVGSSDFGASVWFTFTAPSGGDYTPYATGSNFDTQVVFSDSLASITGGCNDDAPDSYDVVDDWIALGAREQEFVQVSGYDKDRQGYGSVGVTEVFAAADAFGSATDLTLRGGADTAVIGLKFAGTETQQGSEPTSCGSETMTGERPGSPSRL